MSVGLQIVVGLCAAGLLLLVGLGFLVSKACCGGSSRPKVCGPSTMTPACCCACPASSQDKGHHIQVQAQPARGKMQKHPVRMYALKLTHASPYQGQGS